MKLSTRSTYGMRALVELALASGHGPVSAAWIAKRQDLSVAYLEQLLHRLKREGVVTSTRGPRGGYVLSREPQQITMAEVVRVLDGMNGAGKPAKAGRAARRETPGHAQQVASTVQRCVNERLAASLSEVTLQDLCNDVEAESGDSLEHRYVFHI